MSAIDVRPGFAVATAVFSLVVVGALAMGTLAAATHELRMGSDAIHQARAGMAAELGIDQMMATWTLGWNGAYARGFGRTATYSTPDGTAVTTGMTRLSDELLLLTAEARAGPARREVSRVVRLDASEPALIAALAAPAVMDVATATGIDGSDRAPEGWDCPAVATPVPPFAVADTSALARVGHFDWNQLVAGATTRATHLTLDASPRWTGEECDTADPDNWGEPIKANGGACTSYYPVIHSAGDLIIHGGRGQGLLLVDGDLTIQGDFQFFGVVLVRGALRGGPGGSHITGTVSVAQRGSTASLLDGIVIEFSRCAARKALLMLALPVPIVARSWSEGFEND
jgi:hypothetical protein